MPLFKSEKVIQGSDVKVEFRNSNRILNMNTNIFVL